MTPLLTTITALLLAVGGGDREQGLAHYRAGRYAEAQAAFARALEAAPGPLELQWNLALAAWRAGDLAAAEIAAETFAAGSGDGAEGRHRGLLGAIRYAEAEELQRRAATALRDQGAPPAPGREDEPPSDPMPLLERGVQKAFQAKNHFVRAVRATPTAELVRNTERAIKKLEELKRALEELMKQRQQDPQPGDDDQDQQPGEDGEDGQDGQDQQQGDEQQQGDPQQQSEQEQGEQQQGEQPQGGEQNQESSGQPEPGEEGAPEAPEPQPDPSTGEQQGNSPSPEQPPASGEEGAEPQQEQGGRPEEPMRTPEPDPKSPRTDAPGEGGAGQELTPEQAKRLMDRLKQMEQQMKQARVRARAGRKPVERDW